MITIKILKSITIVLLVHIAITGVGYVAGSNHFNDNSIKSNYGSSQADVYNYLQDDLSSPESGDEIGVALAIYKFELIDLGTLPGGNGSTAISINHNGQVVGSSQKQGSDTYYATLFDTSGNGNNIYLGTLGGSSSYANSINDSGQIVGLAVDSRGYQRAVLYDPTGGGNNVDLGTLVQIHSWADAINNRGQIVGGAGRAALFDPTGGGNNIDLRSLGGRYSGALAINGSGQIVGWAYDGLDRGRATLFDPTGNGNNIDLGTLPGHNHSHAESINDGGQIVGFSIDSSGRHHATLFDSSGSGNNIYLGALDDRWSRALSINNSGQIVGSAADRFDQSRACLFDPTGTGNNIDLNTMIDPGRGWLLKFARSINNHGWIVGGGRNQAGENHAYLLIPRPVIYYVDKNARGANNGSSWKNAFYDLQDALAVALNGDEIRVAQGIYKPAVYVPPPPPLPMDSSNDLNFVTSAADRKASFQLKKGVVIKGGYAGLGAPDANARDVETYKTILSGDIMGNDASVSGQYDMEADETRKDNSHHVVTATNIDSNAVLDGCTITGGHADSTADRFMGGGMYIYKANPTITNCTFTENWALDYGGGMCIDIDSAPVIINCNFIANSATDGAGADNEYSNPTFVNCQFLGNWTWEYNADSYGGAGMYNYYSNPKLINCVFAINGSPGWGDGGGMQNNQSNPILINCTFCGNYSANWQIKAGGIYNQYESNPRLTNCILWGNTNPEGEGESAQIYGGQPVINYCCIEGWTGELGGIGNIGADPCFVKAGGWFPGDIEDDSLDDLPVWGDYHLLQTSPCIDTADNNSLPHDIGDLDADGNTVEPLPFDLEDNPRILDGDNDNFPRVDMGAYEFSNKQPIADAGSDQLVECACNTTQGTKVVLDGTNSYDPDKGPLTYTWMGPFAESPAQGVAPTVTLEPGCPGEYVITLVVNDGIEDSEPNEVLITVVDTTPPEFELSVTPTMLWPPNLKMVEITPSWNVTDRCDTSPTVSLVSIVVKEGDDVIGDSNTSDDIEIKDDGSIFVRSKRTGNNTGRIYIITCQAVDETGNISVRSTNVSVPHEFKLLARMGERWLWRNNNGNVPEDLNSDGIVNFMDIAIFSDNWVR